MVTVLVRTLIVYIVLIVVMRLMGKRQLGELEVTDLVSTLLISEIASLPITNSDIPVLVAVIPMITLLGLEVLSSFVLIRFPKLKGLVSAKPTVIIRGGRLDRRALRELRVSLDELMSEIRQQGIADPSQVEYAILEKNGKLTILQKAKYTPPSAETLGLDPPNEGLMHIVYSEAGFSRVGLELIGKDRDWLERQLARRGLRADGLFCVTANEQGKLFWIPKEDN